MSCVFVYGYSMVKLEWFRYQTTRSALLGICDILLWCQLWTLLVPAAGIGAALWLQHKHKLSVVNTIVGVLHSFAVAWILVCLWAWAAQDVPRVTPRGFM
jgi:hypothetical protein